MTTLITLYLLFGLLSYWPLVWHYKINERHKDGHILEWLAAWAVWTLTWPYRYIQDLVYWWRAKK